MKLTTITSFTLSTAQVRYKHPAVVSLEVPNLGLRNKAVSYISLRPKGQHYAEKPFNILPHFWEHLSQPLALGTV